MSAIRGFLFGVAVLALEPALAADGGSSCISCHIVEGDDELSAPVAEWRLSTHAAVEVSCDACHGGDPLESDPELSMSEDQAGFLGSPSWHEVPALCGACHEQILEAYEESVMAAQIATGARVAVCTTCHMTNGHAIARVSAAEILTRERCGQCHDAQRAFDLVDVLESTDKKLEATHARIAQLRGRIDTGRLDRELAAIKDRYISVAHTYNRERIPEIAAASTARLEALSEAADALGGELRLRRRLGLGVTGFFTLVCLGALRLARDLKMRRT